MSTSRKDHLPYRYGICLNPSCEKCKAKIVQQIASRNDFVCEECGRPLRSCPPPKSFAQKYGKLLGIVGALVVIGAIIGIYFTMRSDGEAEIAEPEEISTIETPQVNDTIVATEIAEVAESEAKPAQAIATEPSKPAPVQTASPQTAPSTHKLSYGSWSGTMKNGEPHGNGTLTYSTSHTIDSRDPKGRVAQPGEYIVGEWDNGHLVQGRWFKNDGTKEAVIIGKAG